MSITETIGFFYVIFATGIFTAAWLIAAIYSCIVGSKTCWRWIQAGQLQEAEGRERLTIVRTGR